MMISEQQLNQLQKDGKIEDFTIHKQKPKYKAIHATAKRSEEKGWMHWNLMHQCTEYSYILQTEYYFAKPRKWRFDFYIEMKYLKIGIEYEGIISTKSRHTTLTGYTGDVQKYNKAAILGILVIRYTALNYRECVNDIREILKTTL